MEDVAVRKAGRIGLSAWTVQPISQAKNAESPASITRRFAANGQVSATVSTA
jgi:hypothetical protein